LAGIFLVALALRWWGAGFGLPYTYQVSEQMYADTARIVDEGGWAKIHPLFGVFHIAVLGARQVQHLLAPLLERLELAPEIAATLAGPTAFNLLGRLVNGLAGALTVVPLYLLGARLWDRRVGLVAALLLATCFLHVQNAHYAKTDILACLFVALAAWLALRFAPRGAGWGSVWPYLAAGACAGLAVGAKLLVWPIFVTLAAAHLYAARSGSDGGGDGGRPSWPRAILSGRLAGAYAVAAAAFVASSPAILLRFDDWWTFWTWVVSAGEGGGMDRFDIHAGEAVWRMYLGAAGWGLGAAVALLAVAGVALAVVRRRPAPLLPLLTFPLLLGVFLLRPGNLAHSRYLLPLLPFLLPAAAALVEGISRLRLAPRAAAAATVAAALLVTLQPAVASVRHDRLLTREDTRTRAKRWIEANLPEGSRVQVELWFFSPQLASPRYRPPLSSRLFRVDLTGPYGLSERSKSTGPSQGSLTVDDYLEAGWEYVVTESFTSSVPRLDPEEDRRRLAFYRDLDARGELIHEVSPYKPGETVPFYFDQLYGPTVHLDRFERPGPRIRIYRLPVRQAEGDPAEGPAGPATEPSG
jgi:4-amino-4-deoxy-L-arabinose transferase-like glycosyltransferase